MRTTLLLTLATVICLWAVPAVAQEPDTLDLWIQEIETRCEGDTTFIQPYVGLAAFGQLDPFDASVEFRVDGNLLGTATFRNPGTIPPNQCGLLPPPCNRTCPTYTTPTGQVIPGECIGVSFQGGPVQCGCLYIPMGPQMGYYSDGKALDMHTCTVTIDVDNQIVEADETNNSLTIDFGLPSSVDPPSWSTIKALYR